MIDRSMQNEDIDDDQCQFQEESSESVLNPFKPNFWTISGLEKAKSVIEAFRQSKVSNI